MGSIVQSVGAFNTGAGTTLGVAQGSNPTVNNFLWVVVNSDDATATVADTRGNAHTEKGTVLEPNVNERLRHFVAPITSGGASNTVTATYGASVADRSITVVEVGGVSAYDVQGTETSGTNPTGNATATNTAQPAFGIAACNDYQAGVPGVGTGYTNVGQFTTGDGNANGQRVESKAITTVGSQTANFVNTALNLEGTVFVIFTDSGGSSVLMGQACL